MSAVCPAGHASEALDYCDTCGARIDGAPAAPSSPAASAPAAVQSAPAASAGEPCPNCQLPRVGTDRFCEDCGYDYTTGQVPAPAPVVSQTPWTVTVEPDHAYYERFGAEVEFPPPCPARTFVLTGSQVSIGRRSAQKGLAPELDLTGPPLDPAVSHLHAMLTLSDTGGWLLSDPGSTNGTTVNDSVNPLTPGQLVELSDGNQVHVGAWTTLTFHAPV